MAHLPGDGPGEPDHHRIQKVGQARRQDIAHRHEDGAADHRIEVHLARAGLDGIDGAARELGAVEGQEAGADVQHHSQDHQKSVAADIAPQPQEQSAHIQLLAFEAALVAAGLGAGQASAADQIGVASHQTASLPGPIWV